MPTARFTPNTPRVNSVTRRTRSGTVARYMAGPIVSGLNESASPTETATIPRRTIPSICVQALD